MTVRQFVVTAELQQFLSGLGSQSLTNVVWDQSFLADAPVLPLSPDAVRRSLFFSKLDESAATPTEFDVFVQNLDGSNALQVTVPR